LKTIIKFSAVGFLGTVFDLSIVVILKEIFKLDTRLCAVLGFSFAVSLNFILNKKWTFRWSNDSKSILLYIKYFLSSLFGLSVRIIIVQIFINIGFDEGFNYLLSNLIGILVGFCTNFILARDWVFSLAINNSLGGINER